jgi:hypothetical protein
LHLRTHRRQLAHRHHHHFALHHRCQHCLDHQEN